MDTFAGRLDSLKGSIETLAIQALTPFMEDVLKPMAEDLAGIVNGISAWASENPELTKSLTGVVLGGAAFSVGLIALGTLINSISTIVGGLASGIHLLRGAITLLSTTGLLPLLGPLALGAGLVLAYSNNWLGFRDAVDLAKGALDKLYQSLVDVIRQSEIGRDALMWINPLGQMQWEMQQGGGGGGHMVTPPLVNPFPRAMGGSVMAGTPYVVGERGPELFYPGRSGYIAPNAGGTTINVMMPAAALASPNAARNAGREFGEMIAQEVRRRG